MRQYVVQIITMITVFAFLMSLTGCNESNLTDHELRRSKLIISQLQQQLADCKKTMGENDQKIEDCLNEKDRIKKQADENVTSLMEIFKTENENLIKENAELKAEINSLKGQQQ